MYKRQRLDRYLGQTIFHIRTDKGEHNLPADSVQALCLLYTSAGKPEKGSVVLVGHGTYTPSTATYAMIDYMLKAKGLKNFHVGTIEGYPTFDTMLQQLKDNKTKQVTLVPFMFVAGDHANNDIAVDWKEALEKEGLDVYKRQDVCRKPPSSRHSTLSYVQN